jgi:hypothetical protein
VKQGQWNADIVKNYRINGTLKNGKVKGGFQGIGNGRSRTGEFDLSKE